MQGNDIGGGLVVPRLLIVFEGLIGAIPDKKTLTKAKAYERLHQWQRVINTFEPFEMVLKHLWYLTYNKDFTFDVITYMGEQFVEPIENWLDREDVPHRSVRDEDPNHLARKISSMSNVAAVYDPNPERQFTYGGKGRIVNPAKPDLIGWFGGR